MHLKSKSSIKYFLVKFLSFLKSRNAPIDDLDDIVEYINSIIMNIAKNNYLAGPESNITEDEYKDLNILYAMANDYSEDFVKTIPAFLDEYIQMRNNFDFGISYGTSSAGTYSTPPTHSSST